MGLLNRLFGSVVERTKELVMDDERREALWKEYLKNWSLRQSLARKFDYGTVGKFLTNPDVIPQTMEEIERLTSTEFFTVEKEEKTTEEVIADLRSLRSKDDVRAFSVGVGRDLKVEGFRELFKEIFRVLQTEVHLIRLIKKYPTKELLLKLFELICTHEQVLSWHFYESQFDTDQKNIHQEIMRIARAIILEQEIEEKIESAEEKFVKEISEKMGKIGDEKPEKYKGYRKLAEAIYSALMEIVGLPVELEEGADEYDEIQKAVKEMEKLIDTDDFMFRLVKKLRRKYADEKIRAVALAFRRSFKAAHFLDWEQWHY